ncbi:MAG: GNAT family N-acetyltransferase [Firmicutes bacterium]|jgi:RimJ/RimL family protein N-acetyltransferase|nr:GNAT family N-acetyltransferase [Bacillota bacterium]
MKIEGERIILRPILSSDFPAIIKWTRDPEVGHYMDDDGYPETLADCQEWYQKQRSNRHVRRLVISTRDEVPIGDIELDHIAWRSGDAELRIRIGEGDYRGKGYGVESVTTLLRYAFGEMGLSRIYLRVASTNRAAIRCYEKAGFRKEGKLIRTWSSEELREIYLMRILKDEFYELHPQYCSLAG